MNKHVSVSPPIKPMLAKLTNEIPQVEVTFEPKWDGFRCIIFKNGDDIQLGSRSEKMLTRFFPEILEPINKQLPEKCVIDGELIVIVDNKLDFSNLQQRIHPAESRISKLSKTIPASFVAFDLLSLDETDLRTKTFKNRRTLLEEIMKTSQPPIYLTPNTTDRKQALDWFETFEGAGLDGIIAKPVEDPYVEGKRTQFKLKHSRTADAVAAGFRMHKDKKGVGSILLGLYDKNSELHHVGVASSFTAKQRKELVIELEPLILTDINKHPWHNWADIEANTGQMPGTQHRWSSQKDSRWTPLKIEKVVEVKYSTVINNRFRDVTKMLRWRPDKDPKDCLLSQLKEPTPIGADKILGKNG